MRKTQRLSALVFAALLLCALPFGEASAWLVKTGQVQRGRFSGSGVSFTAPASFTLRDIFKNDTWDEVILEGPRDVNGFIPEIHISLFKDPLVMADFTMDDDLDFVFYNLSGSNALSLLDEPVTLHGGDALRRIIFYNLPDDRMGVLYRYHFNLNGVGVTADYRARTATRSLPDDMAAFPALVEGMKIE